MRCLPIFFVTGHRIEGNDDFPNACGQRGLRFFPVLDQAIVEPPDRGIALHGDECGHIDNLSQFCSPAPGCSPPPHEAAVPVDRGDADEAGCLAPSESTQLGKLGKDRTGDDWPDPGIGAQ